MDRIDGVGNVGGMFVSEDAAISRPPTEVTAKWLNGVQEEIAAVIEAAGIALSASNNQQLLTALEAMLAGVQADIPVSMGWSEITGKPDIWPGAALRLSASPGIAPHFSIRAWWNFDGTGAIGSDMAVHGGGNVSRVEKVSTGVWRIYFTEAMPDANYAPSISVSTYVVNTASPKIAGVNDASYTPVLMTASVLEVAVSSGGSMIDSGVVTGFVVR